MRCPNRQRIALRQLRIEPADAPARLAGQLANGRLPGVGQPFAQPDLRALLAQRRQPQRTAARANRLREQRLPRAEQHEINAERRLLQRLQKGVRRFNGERIGRIDDHHPIRAFKRLDRSDVLNPTHLADADRPRAAVIVIVHRADAAGLHERDVGVANRLVPMLRIKDAPARAALPAGRLRLLADDRLRDLPRQLVLANPLRPADQQRVWEATGVEHRFQRA